MMEQPDPKMFPDPNKCFCGAKAVYKIGKLGKWEAGFCETHFFEKAASMARAIAHELGFEMEGYEPPESEGLQP